MNKVIFLLLYLLLLLHTPQSFGQDYIELDKSSKDISVNDFTFISKSHDATINDIDKILTAPDTNFIKNKNLQEVNYGFDQTFGWCKFTIKNKSDIKNWILKVQQSRVDSVQLYVQIENEQLIKYPITGHFQNIKDRPTYSVHFAYPILLKKDQAGTFYLYTQRKFGRHAAVLTFHKETDFFEYNFFINIYTGIVLGIVFLAGLVGVILCFFVPRKVFIFYSIYCFGFLFLLLTDSGFLHAFFNNTLQPDIMNNTNMIFYYWVVGWHIIFSIELLDINKKSESRVYRTGYISGILFCCLAVILLLPVPDFIRRSLSRWSYYIIFFVDAYILYVIIIKIVKKKVIAYFYLLGFLFTLFAATVLMLADLQILTGINQRTDIFIITPVIEIIFMSIGLGIHFSNNIKEKLNAQLQLNETQTRIISIQEDERKRIAQDLHDDVGNSLAALKNMIRYKHGNYNIEEEIDKILLDIRNISHNLMPIDFTTNELTEIIKQMIEKFDTHETIQFEYDETGTPIKLKLHTELVIYRIINELITNIVKHAAATKAMVQLIYQIDSLIVMVEDNGIGISPSLLSKSNGIGLANVQYRSHYIQAQFKVESDSKGSLIIIEIPYERNR